MPQSSGGGGFLSGLMGSVAQGERLVGCAGDIRALGGIYCMPCMLRHRFYAATVILMPDTLCCWSAIYGWPLDTCSSSWLASSGAVHCSCNRQSAIATCT